MYEKIIVDADLCIKLGGSEKYRFYYFTTNDVRSLQKPAVFCSFRPVLPNW